MPTPPGAFHAIMPPKGSWGPKPHAGWERAAATAAFGSPCAGALGSILKAQPGAAKDALRKAFGKADSNSPFHYSWGAQLSRFCKLPPGADAKAWIVFSRNGAGGAHFDCWIPQEFLAGRPEIQAVAHWWGAPPEEIYQAAEHFPELSERLGQRAWRGATSAKFCSTRARGATTRPSNCARLARELCSGRSPTEG